MRPWTPSEIEAIEPNERMPTSEWVSEHYEIVSKDASRPGPYRHELAPYLPGIMDAADDRHVDLIVLMKAARVGGSELGNILIGSWVDQDPGPVLLVYPTEPSAKERIRNEVQPLFLRIDRLKRHLGTGRWDMTAGEIDLMPCRIYVGWAGSPQALASRSIAKLLLDEIDKFPTFSGRDASPVALAIRRTANYRGRRTILVLSTPTTRLTGIAAEFEKCVDRRDWVVPCPECGKHQKLTHPYLRWPGQGEWNGTRFEGGDPRDSRIRSNEVAVAQSAWFECRHNGCRIDETHKSRMTNAGMWKSRGFSAGTHPKSRRRGFHIGAFETVIGDSWSDIAAQWILADGDTALEYELHTQVFGVAFDRTKNNVDVDALVKRQKQASRRLSVPSWAVSVLLTVDTQARSFWWVLRAWNDDYSRSKKIGHGSVESVEALESVERGRYFAEDGETVFAVALVGIDSGGGVQLEGEEDATTTDLVYRWCGESPRMRIPLKGHPASRRPAQRITTKEAEYRPGRRRRKYHQHAVKLHIVDTHWYKDRLADLIAGKFETWDASDLDETYIAHMSSETKVSTVKNGKLETMWQPVTSGRDTDLRDCEVYQLALADIARAAGVVSKRERPSDRRARTEPRERKPSRWATPDGRPFLITRR